MALPSFFKRKNPPSRPAPPAEPVGDEAAAVQLARARARRRLIGAVVLLAIGVVGFPMLFETQPRPLPRDIPIEMPRQAAAPAPSPLPRHSSAVTELPVESEAAASAPEATVVAAAPAPAPSPTPAPATPVPAAAADTRPAPSHTTPAVAPTTAPAAAPPAAPVPTPTPAPRPAANDGERARALLEGSTTAESPRPAAAASDNKALRFVVQVGAYTDASTLREVRIKVERLGLKTYTQTVDTEAGKRTRVRVGPFNTRQDAEGASGKLKSAGLPGHVLTL